MGHLMAFGIDPVSDMQVKTWGNQLVVRVIAGSLPQGVVGPNVLAMMSPGVLLR